LFLGLAVVGLAVGVLGLVQDARAPKGHPYAVRALPASLSLRLTAGSWTVYEHPLSGGATPTINLRVLAAGGVQMPVGGALGIAAGPLHEDGSTFTPADDTTIPTTATYRVELSAPTAVRVIVARSVPASPFPWSGLVVDGVALVLAGTVLILIDVRRSDDEDREPQGPPTRTLVTAG
jgi:hypothetical protein